MRIKLRPDHLGEVNVRVTTLNNEVGLQIQATDEKAKKVIEDSMSYLKESLASHRLNLGSVELSLVPDQVDSNQPRHLSDQDFGSKNFSGWNGPNEGFEGRSERHFRDPETREYAEPRLVGAPLRGNTAPLKSGRLDVRA